MSDIRIPLRQHDWRCFGRCLIWQQDAKWKFFSCTAYHEPSGRFLVMPRISPQALAKVQIQMEDNGENLEGILKPKRNWKEGKAIHGDKEVTVYIYKH